MSETTDLPDLTPAWRQIRALQRRSLSSSQAAHIFTQTSSTVSGHHRQSVYTSRPSQRPARKADRRLRLGVMSLPAQYRSMSPALRRRVSIPKVHPAVDPDYRSVLGPLTAEPSSCEENLCHGQGGRQEVEPDQKNDQAQSPKHSSPAL